MQTSARMWQDSNQPNLFSTTSIENWGDILFSDLSLEGGLKKNPPRASETSFLVMHLSWSKIKTMIGDYVRQVNKLTTDKLKRKKKSDHVCSDAGCIWCVGKNDQCDNVFGDGSDMNYIYKTLEFDICWEAVIFTTGLYRTTLHSGKVRPTFYIGLCFRTYTFAALLLNPSVMSTALWLRIRNSGSLWVWNTENLGVF